MFQYVLYVKQVVEDLIDSPSNYSDDSSEASDLLDIIANITEKALNDGALTETSTDEDTQRKSTAKRKRKPQKFIDELLKAPDFQRWLQKRKKPNISTESQVFQPYCTACSEYLSCLKNYI